LQVLVLNLADQPLRQLFEIAAVGALGVQSNGNAARGAERGVGEQLDAVDQ